MTPYLEGEIVELPALPGGNSESDILARKLLKACYQKDILPYYNGAQETPTAIRLFLSPSSPDDDQRIARLPLKRLCGVKQDPRIVSEGEYLVIEVPRQERYFPHYRDFLNQLTPDEPVQLAIGVDSYGRLVRSSVVDLVHLLGGGTTGSGKSGTAQSLAFSLAYTYSPDIVRLVIIDPKKVTFPGKIWDVIPHLAPVCEGYEHRVITKEKDVLPTLESLYEVAEERYHLLETTGCENVYEYNQKHPSKLPIIFIFIDELSKFKDGEELQSDLAYQLEKTAAYVRAAGIVLIIFTQKPVSSIVPSMVKGNLPSGLGLKTKTHVESLLIINETGCEKLAGKGDCLFAENGNEPIRLQVPDGAKTLLPLVTQKWGVKPIIESSNSADLDTAKTDNQPQDQLPNQEGNSSNNSSEDNPSSPESPQPESESFTFTPSPPSVSSETDKIAAETFLRVKELRGEVIGEGLSRNAVIKEIWGVTGGKGYQKKAAYLDSVLVKYAPGWVRELLAQTEATHKAILLHVFLCQETDKQRIQKYAPEFIKLLHEVGIEPDDSLDSIG
ncbi:MAG: FtsK/SpoIIIE domain-containing protein [Jaaginema sp. PMC 1079.18]|nr:FtsK/SpoIIIE domain-containing protein [Jaaginema sp. PMC 1080.18]MEC4853846.1 FtsK/SpoIIIE domain-containing protein [Jaaginema sp. PMC 1079.18]MEC4869131.1 FtsK/SpoIIIE domain-containing protein [Jaaginema sp. PMC 1078.18]